MKPEIEKLLQLPNTWQARLGPKALQSHPTGFTKLDDALHLGGWPQGATTELLQAKPGYGELPLLLPGLRQQQQKAPWLVMIDPPFPPFAPALRTHGVELERLLLLYPKNLKDLLWCATQCLSSGSCSSVITWGHKALLADKELRRLQQAAATGQCWHVLLRGNQSQQQASPSALRLKLTPQGGGSLAVEVLKQRGGWSGQQLQLKVTDLSKDSMPQHKLVYLTDLPEHPASTEDNLATGYRYNTASKALNETRVIPLRPPISSVASME